jgi:hypothetical protein
MIKFISVERMMQTTLVAFLRIYWLVWFFRNTRFGWATIIGLICQAEGGLRRFYKGPARFSCDRRWTPGRSMHPVPVGN